MSKQKITITRALVELKRLDQRINAAIHSPEPFVYVSLGKGADMKVSGKSNVSVKEADAKMQSAADSIESLIKNRQKLKAAIVASNATTSIKVGSEDVTVAEAIEMKQSVEYKVNLLNRLRADRARAQQGVDIQMSKLEQNTQELLGKLFSREKPATEQEVKAIRDQMENKDLAQIVGLHKLDARIEKLAREVEVINDELDFGLSESNSATFVEVDLTS